MAIFSKPNVNIQWANSGQNVDPGQSKYDQGWLGGEKPPAQNFNFILGRYGGFQRHVNESGIARWDSITSYSVGSLVTFSVSANNVRIYKSSIDSNQNNAPNASPGQWIDITDKFLNSGYVEVFGTNTLTGTISYPNVQSISIGSTFFLKIENENTSSVVTLNINGTGDRQVRLVDNDVLHVGALKPGMIAQVVYVQAQDMVEKFFLINPYEQTQLLEPGFVTLYAGNASSPPNGFFYCRGQELSRSIYSQLFSAIGTIHGAGNGSTTFNIPDTKGRFMRGFDSGGGDDPGRVFGSYQADEIISHKHDLTTLPTIGLLTGPHSRNGSGSGAFLEETQLTGGSETRPKNLAFNYIIKY